MHDIRLQSKRMQDEAFLYELYASTRQQEISAWGWPLQQQESFLTMQYQMQQHSYQIQYADGECFIILCENRPVGRLLVARREKEWVIVDISLIREFQNRGIGSSLISEFLREASEAGRPVRLSVMRGNPARRLYERLGFALLQEDQMYAVMRFAELGFNEK